MLNLAANKGSKMVVFGGRSRGGAVRGSIFFLDVFEMKWSQGPDADPSQHRYGMACTVAGDNVVIWGGRFAPFFALFCKILSRNALLRILHY